MTMMTANAGPALGKGKLLSFKDKMIFVEPLDLNDLTDLETEIGDVVGFDPTRLAHQRALLWLVLRKNDDTLTDDQRRYCRYNMSVQDAGREMDSSVVTDPATALFMLDVLRLTGLFGAAGEDGPAQKNALEAIGKILDSESMTLSPSSSSAAATPTGTPGGRRGRSSKTS